MEYTILIVENNREEAWCLEKYFSGKGFCVQIATNGLEAVKMAERNPDIMLIDINIPEMDGFEVCKRIRGYVTFPILFLTGYVDEESKIKGFSVGGDDYIVKPISFSELGARVMAHLRREARHGAAVKVRFQDNLTIDYVAHCVYYKNQIVSLAKKEFEIVVLLSGNPGRVFDKDSIYEKIWGFDGEGNSDVVAEHIRRIRVKLSQFTQSQYIETVWGCGYKWTKTGSDVLLGGG